MQLQAHKRDLWDENDFRLHVLHAHDMNRQHYQILSCVYLLQSVRCGRDQTSLRNTLRYVVTSTEGHSGHRLDLSVRHRDSRPNIIDRGGTTEQWRATSPGRPLHYAGSSAYNAVAELAASDESGA